MWFYGHFIVYSVNFARPGIIFNSNKYLEANKYTIITVVIHLQITYSTNNVMLLEN